MSRKRPSGPFLGLEAWDTLSPPPGNALEGLFCASAAALILFAIVFTITVINLLISRKNVQV